MEFFFLLLLTVPVFYIIGVIATFRSIFGSKNKEENRGVFLRRMLAELSTVAKETPKKTIAEVVKQYEAIYQKYTKEEGAYFIPVGVETVAKEDVSSSNVFHAKEEKQEVNLSGAWENWYADNSVNLLLYIGAFFIVASATIFVGFQWESIGGTVKAFTLILITLAFFGFGAWFYAEPKVRNAGVTFITIGSLLIPFNGLAWYNFVFGPAGYSVGSMWLITSFIAVIVYTIIAYSIRNPLYTYIAGCGGLSMMLALVNITQGRQEYYVLAGIFFAFVLLLLTRLFGNPTEEDKKIFITPLTLSAHVTMPLALFFGFAIASSQGSLYTMEASIAVVLGSLYYLVSYSLDPKEQYIAASALLFPVSVFLFARWFGMSDVFTYYMLDIVFVFYLGISYVLKENKFKAYEMITIISLSYTAVLLLYALGTDFSKIHVVMLSAIPTVLGLVAYILFNRAWYLYYNGIFLAVTMYLITANIIIIPDKYAYLGIVYGLVSVFFYLPIIASLQKKEEMQAYFAIAVFHGILCLSLVAYKPLFLLGMSSIYGCIFLDAAYRVKQKQLLYFSNAFFYLAVWAGLHYWNVQESWYVLVFTVFSLGIYMVSFIHKEVAYRNTGLLGVGISTILFGILGNTSYGVSTTETERNGLISSYLSFFLFSFDSIVGDKRERKYFASAVGMFTYLWQMQFLGYTQWQVFAFPLGVYFIALAYVQKIKKNIEQSKTLDSAGLFILFGSLFLQSFERNGFYYAIMLMGEGIAFFAAGNTLSYKLYTYAGIAAIVIAVISQSYEYLFSLPRWIITAVLGVVFLSVAIYLLLNRKEQKN